MSVEIQADAYIADLLLACILGLTTINFAVFYLVTQLGKVHIIKVQNELLLQQFQYQSQYTEAIKQQHLTTLHLEHDVKHSLAVIGVLLDQKNYTEAKILLEKYKNGASMSSIPVETDNIVLNAIVSLKFSYAHSIGIKIFCALPEKFNLLEDVDLCNLLGNMLDNAIEYCEKNINEDNDISVIINQTEFDCSIVVKNTIYESVVSNNKKLATTKSDKEKHGIGMKTIENIAKKNDGIFDYFEYEGLFYVKLILFL